MQSGVSKWLGESISGTFFIDENLTTDDYSSMVKELNVAKVPNTESQFLE